MHTLVEILALRKPTDPVIETAGRIMSAADVLHAVERLGEFLEHGTINRLALLADNSADWIVADLACQSVGICLLPLPVFFADSQLAHSLASVGVDGILTNDPQRCLRLSPNAEFVSQAIAGCGLTLVRLPASEHSSLPEGTQKITFTSGSTGTPRGVCLSTLQQLRVAASLRDALGLQTPRHLCLLPLSTLLENIGSVYWTLLANGTVMVPPQKDTGFSGSTGLDLLRLIGTLERYRPTSIILLPQMLVGLVSLLEEGWRPPVELRFAAVGGARVDAKLLSRARALGLPVYEGYGLSETGSVCCLNHPASERTGSVGQPLAHVDLRVEDGEIVVAGNAFLGYVGDRSSWGQKYIATGDLGRQDQDGFVYVEGRRKNLLISSFGRNISPEWIESQLLANPLVAHCVVVGDDRPYCTALIVPAPAADSQQIQRAIDKINGNLPDYARICKWHPVSVSPDAGAALFTENGKPRRAGFVERFAAEIETLYSPIPGVSAA